MFVFETNIMNLPRYHKRAFAHNYHAPFIYHIILKKMKGAMDFGEVAGDARIPFGSEGGAFIKESVLGAIIAKKIIEIQKKFPILQIYQFCVMPLLLGRSPNDSRNSTLKRYYD